MKKVLIGLFAIVCFSSSILAQTIKDTEPGALDKSQVAGVVGAVGDTPIPLTPEQIAERVSLVLEITRILGVEGQIMFNLDTFLKGKGWAYNANQPGGGMLYEKELTYKDNVTGQDVTRTFRVDQAAAISIQLDLDPQGIPNSTSALDIESRNKFLVSAGWLNVKDKQTNSDLWAKDITYESADKNIITRTFLLQRDSAMLFENYMDLEVLSKVIAYDENVIKAQSGQSIPRY